MLLPSPSPDWCWSPCSRRRMIVPVTVCIITLPPTGGPDPAAAAAAAAEAEAAAQEVRDWGISQVCRYSVAGDKRRVIPSRCLCTLRVKCWGSTPQQCPSPPTHAHARSQGQRCVLSNPDLSHSLHGTSLRHLIVSAVTLTFIRAAGDGGNGRGPRASSRGNLRLTSPQFTSWPVQFPLLMQGNAAGQRIAAAAQPCSCRSHARLQHDPVRRHGGVRCCFCALSRCGRQVHV